MRKFIYQSIVDKLSEIQDADNNSVIQHFDIWNNNIISAGEGEQEETFDKPAVFVEFQPIEWIHQGSISRYLHGHTKISEDFKHDALTATQSVTDYDAKELRNDIEIFTCQTQDASAVPEYQTVTPTAYINVL